MPFIERPGDYILGSRVTFERDSSAPNPGLKDVGTYYTFSSDQTIAAAAGLIGLGLQGFVHISPRKFNTGWNQIIRSSPAPTYFGSFSERSVVVSQLYYHGRNRAEVEEFVEQLPDRIGPFEGLLRVYDKDFTTLLYGYPQCHLAKVDVTDEGAKNFVEYTLTFETNQKKLSAAEVALIPIPAPVYNPEAGVPEFFA